MQFVKNGPDIPDRLLQAHEDEKVVFFCGAGISSSARLPDFKKLVEQIYLELGERRSPEEQVAFKNKQYDTVIGLLEGRVVGGRATVRRQLARILIPDLTTPKATEIHEELLTLARSRKGRYRLITTNFDRLFEKIIDRQGIDILRYQAPLFPVPKKGWEGLVYLHGLLPAIPEETGLDRLVISSGDFGLAYLTERWAARFVSELFRNYTVCFIGYSINDPVLRYMMDALAVNRLLGETSPEMFAIGGHKKGQKEATENEWKAKNVAPVLYRVGHSHYFLRSTLRAWAETYRDGVLGKERIVVQYAMAKPIASTKQDDFASRMVWALSERSGLPAKRFAELEPPPAFDWLESLSEDRFNHQDLIRFGVPPDADEDNKLAFSLVARPAPYSRAPWMSLVQGIHNVSKLDEVMFQFARWLTRHLEDPKLILWVAERGGRLHHQFADLIERAMREHPITALMQTLWRLVLTDRLANPIAHFKHYEWFNQFKQGGLTPTLRLQLRCLLSPRIKLREAFQWGNVYERARDSKSNRIKKRIDGEIVLADDYIHSTLKNLSREPQWQEALPDLLPDFTALLHDALDLMRELGDVDNKHDHSFLYKPSISEHPQNHSFRDWTVLIELARDAWLATTAKSPELARLEAQRWFSIPYPLFRRLVFFAAANSALFTPEETLKWLLSDDCWWLWSVETERETLRLLVTLAPKLNDQNREILEQAITRGPPREMFPINIEDDQLDQSFDRKVWLRLAKCNATGAQLGTDAAGKLKDLSQRYPRWQLTDDEREEFPVWTGDDADWRTYLATPERCRELVQWLRKHPKSETWRKDDWFKRCKRDFRRTATALVYLANKDKWLAERWREALQAWKGNEVAMRSWRCVGGALMAAPDNVVKVFINELCWWLQAVAEKFSGNEEAFFSLLHKVITLCQEESLDINGKRLIEEAINHPIGHVTEAALRWWGRQSLHDDQGLTDPIRALFTELCNTHVLSFRYGRVLLASHVITLFRVDRAWSQKYLLPLFNWQLNADEAGAAWQGFCSSPRLYKPLLEIEDFKQQFLSTAEHYPELGEVGREYAALLAYAALELGDAFSNKELASATHVLPVEGLQASAATLVCALESAGEQHAEYWRNRILPYLKAIWPKSRDKITPFISEAFAKLCVAAGEAFPEASQEVQPWLQQQEYPGDVVNRLDEAGLCSRFPENALSFLSKIIGNNAQSPPSALKDCLNAIKSVQSSLAKDEHFQQLHQYLRLHDLP